MKYAVNVTVQIDKTYIVDTEDRYAAVDEGEYLACKEYGKDPDFSSAEAWDVTPAEKAL